MAVGYTAEVYSLFNSNDAQKIFGVTALSLNGTTLTFTTTSYAGAGSTTVSMLSASELRLYKGATEYSLATGVSTHTSGSTAFDVKNAAYSISGSGAGLSSI